MPLNRITADELLVAGINTGLATIFSGPVGGIIVGTTSLLSAIFSGRPEPIKQNVNLRVEPFIKNRRVYGYSRYDAWNIWAGTRTRLAVTPDGNIPTKFLDIYCHLSEGHMGEISGVFVNDEWVPLTRGIDGIYRVRPGSKYEKFLFVRTYLEPTRLPPYLKTNYIDSVTDKYSLEASFELRTTDYHSGHSFAVVTLSDREGDTNDKKEKLSWDNGVPTINFLGKGIRVPDLSNLTGSNVYTDNSVSIMYDVFKNMCGGDTGLFDQHTLFMSYNWALNKVYNEYGLFDNLGIRLTQGSLKDAFYTKYPMVSKRASFNGVIEYGESFLNLMKDFSVIMEGGFFVYGGKIHTYYGSKSWINPIKITEGDLENKSKNVAVDIIQRDIFNTAIARIDQSGPFDYKQLEAEFEDSPSISRDGQKNPKDFGTIRGVNDPFNLSRLLAQPIVSTKLYGKIIRGTFVGEKILRLKKDQKVIIDFPTKNITNQKATVQFVQFTTGQSATVIFKVSDEKEHTDDYKLPNRQSISNYPDAPEPPFDIVTNVVRSFESGQENLKISLSFKISGNTLRIIGSVKGSEKNDSIDWQTINSQEIQYKEILGIKRETEYTITLQSIGTNGLYSDIVSVTIDSSKDSTAPLAPAGVSTTSGAGYYTARWTDPTEEDYSYTNIYQGSQSDFVPASDNLVWSGSDQPSIITDRAVGTHYVKISHVDSSGNESLFSPTSVAVTALTITGNKFTISADTAGAPADTSGGNGDVHVDSDGVIYEKSGGTWTRVNISFVGSPGTKTTIGSTRPQMPATNDIHIDPNGDVQRYSGTRWVFVQNIKGAKGERGIGIYDPSNVPTTLFDGDLRVNRDGTVDRYNGTTWVSTGTDLSGGDGDPGDNAPITTAGSRPSDPGTGDLNVDTDGRVFRYDGSDWVYTNVNLKGPTTTAGSRPSNPNTGDLNVDTDGRVFRYSGTAWINTNIDLTGPESAKVYSGPISADSSPTVTGAPTGSVFVAADGRYWRYSGTSWVFQKDLTGVKGGKGDKGERGIGIYDPSNVPTTLFDGDLRVNRDGTVDRYNGTTWVSTGTDLSGGVGDNAPITTAGARPSDPGTGDLNVDTNGRVFRYSGTCWVYTNVNLKGPTTTAGARPSNPNTGDLNVDTDGRVFRYSGTAWVNTNIDLTGPESAKVYSGPISADSSPTVTGAPTGSVFVAADGRYWRYSGTSWVFQKDLTGVKGERGIGYYTASEVPSLSDRIIGDNRVNDNGRVDTWDGTDWQETGIDLTGPPNARVYSKNLTDGSNPTLADTGEDSEDDIIEGSAFFDTSDGRWWSWSGTAWTSNGTLKGIGFAEKAVYRVVSISTTVFVSPTVSGNMVYSPTAHTISNLPSGWFNNVPTYNHLTQKVIGSQSTCGTDGSVNVFSSPFIYTDDTDINIVYIRTDSDISTTLPSSESNRIPTGWSDLVPTGTQILWARDVIRPSGQIQWTYGRPYKVEGIDGIDGKSGMPGYSVTYLYNAIQDGSSVPNSSGEFRLQTSTNSSGLTSLLDMKSATILELSPPSNYTQNQSLAFLTNINAALNLNTVVVVFVSIFKWIAFTITSKSVTGTNLLLGISHFADVFATGANIGSSELVSIHLSYVSSAASPEQTKFSTPVLSGVLGNTQATLTWTGESSNPNADLEYKQSSQGDSQYINWPGTDTSPETITGLTNTTSYDFRVKYLASGTNLDSSYSNVVSLTPVAPLAAPITPVSPTLSTVGMGIRATIPLITGVEEWQFRWENSTSQGQLVNPESSAWLSSPTINITSEDSSPLVNGRRYFIQVRVRNTAGTSGWSSLSSVSYRPVPDEITTWSLSQTTDGFGAQRIQISATIPSNSNGWKVYRNQTGTFSETDRQYTFGSTVVDYTDFETSVGGTYYYWLRPINTSTDGPLTGRKTFTLSVSDPNPLEITKSSDIAKYFTADSISSNNAGTWIYDSSGSSASGNTGPGSNNVLGFMHTETSGANYNEGTWQDNGIAQFKSVPTKSNRILRLRVCVQGDFNDGTEGLRVQHRATGSGGWTTITTIRGWDLNNSYVSGSTFTDEGGTSQTVVAKGGWIDVDVSIPDTATQVRLFPRYILGQAGEFYQHDTALRSFQWRTGTAPIVVPKPGPITGFSTNNITSNSVGYSFSSPTTNSSIVTSYSVKLFQGTYSTSNHPTGSSEDTDTFNPSDTLSGSFTGLTPNTTYTIQYFASPVSGTSGLQNVRYVTFTTSQAVSSDTTPNSMNFSSSSRVGGNVSSGFPNTVSGLGSGVSVTCSLSASLPSGWSARYEKNGSWVNFSVTTSFSVTNGDTIRFGLQGVTTSGTATISYSIGSNPGISSSWIYSRDPDTTPNSFDLGSDSDVTTLDGVNSDTITIGGLTDGDSAAASWSVTDTVSNPVQVTARLNGATQSNSFSRPVTNGDKIYLRCVMFGNGIATIVLTIGGVSDTWVVTRTSDSDPTDPVDPPDPDPSDPVPDDTTPNSFDLGSDSDVTSSSSVDSDTFTVGGLTAGVSVPASWSVTDTVANPVQVTARLNGATQSNSFSRSVTNGDEIYLKCAMFGNGIATIVLTIGGVRDTWIVTRT